MPLWVPKDKLSAFQMQPINDAFSYGRSNVYINGFAGSGKTIILLHTMDRLLQAYNESDICYLTYTNSLIDLARSVPLFTDTFKRNQMLTFNSFLSSKKSGFEYLIIDEAQDIMANAFDSIISSGKRIICAGDFAQQIYDDTVTEEKFFQRLKPLTYQLKEVFRLTKNACQFALSVSPNIALMDGLRAHTNPNSSIKIFDMPDYSNESIFIYNQALNNAIPNYPSVILFPFMSSINQFSNNISKKLGLGKSPAIYSTNDRSRKLYVLKRFNQFWENNNIKMSYYGGGVGSIRDAATKPHIYLMTYHSSKGLDFKNVYLPFLANDLSFLTDRQRNIFKNMNPKLLFTALTRSYENLYITYSGNKIHNLLDNIPQNTYVKSVNPSF